MSIPLYEASFRMQTEINAETTVNSEFHSTMERQTPISNGRTRTESFWKHRSFDGNTGAIVQFTNINTKDAPSAIGAIRLPVSDPEEVAEYLTENYNWFKEVAKDFLETHFKRTNCPLGAGEELTLDDFSFGFVVNTVTAEAKEMNPYGRQEGQMWMLHVPSLLRLARIDHIADGVRTESWQLVLTGIIHLSEPMKRATYLAKKKLKDAEEQLQQQQLQQQQQQLQQQQLQQQAVQQQQQQQSQRYQQPGHVRAGPPRASYAPRFLQRDQPRYASQSTYRSTVPRQQQQFQAMEARAPLAPIQEVRRQPQMSTQQLVSWADIMPATPPTPAPSGFATPLAPSTPAPPGFAPSPAPKQLMAFPPAPK